MCTEIVRMYVFVKRLTHLGEQSRFGDKSLKFQVVGPQRATEVHPTFHSHSVYSC